MAELDLIKLATEIHIRIKEYKKIKGFWKRWARHKEYKQIKALVNQYNKTVGFIAIYF